jgi:hypothetical protein
VPMFSPLAYGGSGRAFGDPGEWRAFTGRR